jgi:hypothetical protein
MSSLAMCSGSNITPSSGWHSWASTDRTPVVVAGGSANVASGGWAARPLLEFPMKVMAALEMGDLGGEAPRLNASSDGVEALVFKR